MIKRYWVYFLFLMGGFSVFSQSIVVDSTTYTIPELVTDVLISSPCAEVSNINWNNCDDGIGYFTNTNPNFPMGEGIVLTTGILSQIFGPYSNNTNNSFNCGVDNNTSSSLFTYMQNLGIDPDLVNYNDVTVLEFDFLPFTDAMSFNFLFASEEYGYWQCEYSDAFAFFLTNTVTGVTTNLALVPGTSDPITVLTIRDQLLNPSCPSVNEHFFGYNNNGVNSAINYEGQTVMMTAEATVVPNTLYHIQIIIGDRNHGYHNSAVFIEAGSFNVGTTNIWYELGIGSETDDMLESNGLALCPGECKELNSGLPASGYTFVWTKDGVVLPGETGPSITVCEAGEYCVEATNSGAATICTQTDCLVVEYLPGFTVNPTPEPIVFCDDGSGSYSYNFNDHITEILGSGNDPADFDVTYYETAQDAQNGYPQIPAVYTATQNTTTIYVRVENFSFVCAAFTEFEILVVDCSITVTQPGDLLVCDSSGSTATFDLTQQNNVILNGLNPTDYVVTYYTSQAGADDGTFDLATPFTAYPNTSNPQTIYVRVEELATGYIGTTSFEIMVAPQPFLTSLSGVTPICETENAVFYFEGTPNATVNFTLNGVTNEITLDTNGEGYYTITNPTSNQTIILNSIYTSDCTEILNGTHTIVVNPNPIPTLQGGSICVDANGNIMTSFILQAQGSFTTTTQFEWYETSNTTNPIATTTTVEISINQPGNYYVTATNSSTGCSATSNTVAVTQIQAAATITATSGEMFSDNATITVTVTGATGTLLYQLDQSGYQSETIFTNVPAGEHIITVFDAEGCTYLTTTVMVIDYPKYFTPNGDGYHDTWDITGLRQTDAVIYIFDRYGKLLKQLFPGSSGGWDGTYNGNQMPSTDYWFLLKYTENNVAKEFKAHFALKR